MKVERWGFFDLVKVGERWYNDDIDKENDALYFRLDESAIVESEKVQPGVILDFDASGRVVGVEMLTLSLRTQPDTLRLLEFETVG